MQLIFVFAIFLLVSGTNSYEFDDDEYDAMLQYIENDEKLREIRDFFRCTKEEIRSAQKCFFNYYEKFGLDKGQMEVQAYFYERDIETFADSLNIWKWQAEWMNCLADVPYWCYSSDKLANWYNLTYEEGELLNDDYNYNTFLLNNFGRRMREEVSVGEVQCVIHRQRSNWKECKTNLTKDWVETEDWETSDVIEMCRRSTEFVQCVMSDAKRCGNGRASTYVCPPLIEWLHKYHGPEKSKCDLYGECYLFSRSV